MNDEVISKLKEFSKDFDKIRKQENRFNIFEVMGVESKEVTLHSNFLAYLLSPISNHGKGSLFLELFLKQAKQLESIKENVSRAEVVPEYRLKPADDVYGRIDLLIKVSDNISVVIENKIYAYDQERQLERYEKGTREPDKRIYIIYLTLDGRDPDEYTLGKLDKEEVICLSYKENILNWLTDCLKEIIFDAELRETVRQYIEVIKRITNQSKRSDIVMEYAKVLKKNALEIDFELLQESIIALKAEAVLNLLNGIKERFDKVIDDGTLYKKYSMNPEFIVNFFKVVVKGYVGFEIILSDKLSIFIGLDDYGNRKFFYRFSLKDTNRDSSLSNWIRSRKMTEDGYSDGAVTFYRYFQENLEFSSPAFPFKKFLGDAGKEEIRKFTDELLKKIQEDLGTEI
ncbi:MAG TPA: PD-(D/E)XK nuclease family protein, partial [Leptospiraceae bacterium]|nr:PD-(D/E)XK nuclease family protein [Leptospiraceae bacterium]